MKLGLFALCAALLMGPDVLRADPLAFVLRDGTLRVPVRDIERAELFRSSTGDIIVDVSLTEDMSFRLSDFTSAARGQDLRVEVCGDAVVELTIEAPLYGRLLWFRDLSEPRAIEVVEMLTGRQPCDGS